MSLRLAAALCCAAVAWGQLPRPGNSEPPANTSGIAARSSAADYLVHVIAPGVTLGAVVLSPAQVKKLFPENLDAKGYIVVEVGLFPEKGGQVTVDTAQFHLQVGDDRTMRRALEPREIVDPPRSRMPSQGPQLPGNVPVTTSSTIGYENGPYRRGVYTGESATVGNDPRRMPPPQPADRAFELERELTDKELAVGKTSVPVAGYLYFPKPKQKQKNPPFDLTYRGEGDPVHLAIPPVK